MIEINIIGRIGQDAVKKFVDGKTVISFSVAYSSVFKKKDESIPDSWVSCSYWTESKIFDYLKKEHWYMSAVVLTLKPIGKITMS